MLELVACSRQDDDSCFQRNVVEAYTLALVKISADWMPAATETPAVQVAARDGENVMALPIFVWLTKAGPAKNLRAALSTPVAVHPVREALRPVKYVSPSFVFSARSCTVVPSDVEDELVPKDRSEA